MLYPVAFDTPLKVSNTSPGVPGSACSRLGPAGEPGTTSALTLTLSKVEVFGLPAPFMVMNSPARIDPPAGMFTVSLPRSCQRLPSSETRFWYVWPLRWVRIQIGPLLPAPPGFSLRTPIALEAPRSTACVPAFSRQDG